MAKWTIGKGLDEYLAKLGDLEFKCPEALGRATYQGAKIVADQIRANIQALPVADSENKKHQHRYPNQAEKDGLLEGLGISTHRVEGGYYNVKIGMDGYNSNKTPKYPNGQPNALIARSIESGSSFRIRVPFISRAVNATKAAAEEAMKNEVDKVISETMK